MQRVLQVVNKMDRAGLETMLMNYYRTIDRAQMQFDFLTHRPDSGHYDEEICQLGGRVYKAPRLYPQNYPAYFKWMRDFFKKHPEYTIVHSHIDAMSYMPLLAAKKAGVPVRIAHSHNSDIDRDFKYPLKLWFRTRLKQVDTEEWACGKAAGDFLFCGREFKVIPNAIRVDDYSFSREVRNNVHKELGIQEGTVVIGHVGRFYYQKNQPFLIRSFKEFCRAIPNSVLLLVGDGELKEQAERAAGDAQIKEKIQFLGVREDISRLMQAMDLFVMPSLFEGVPLVALEAQAAGLPLLLSERVPCEVNLTGNCTFLSLEAGETQWAKTMEAMLRNRQPRYNPDLKSYNIQKAAPELQRQYQELENRAKKEAVE